HWLPDLGLLADVVVRPDLALLLRDTATGALEVRPVAPDDQVDDAGGAAVARGRLRLAGDEPGERLGVLVGTRTVQHPGRGGEGRRVSADGDLEALRLQVVGDAARLPVDAAAVEHAHPHLARRDRLAAGLGLLGHRPVVADGREERL